MKFVSRHGNHKIGIIPQTQSPIVNPSGSTVFVPNQDGFEAVFEIKTLTATEIDAAKTQIFANATDGQAFGSIPKTDSGLLDVQEGIAAGYNRLNYDGYDVYQNLSTFDTSDPLQCPQAQRELIEQYLLNCGEFGRSYVRVDNWNLQPPWPTYPMGDTVNVVHVVKFAQAGGMLNEALAYERAELQREDLIVGYEAALRAEQAVAEEDAGLTAKV